jgi:hypothetical protein
MTNPRIEASSVIGRHSRWIELSIQSLQGRVYHYPIGEDKEKREIRQVGEEIHLRVSRKMPEQPSPVKMDRAREVAGTQMRGRMHWRSTAAE